MSGGPRWLLRRVRRPQAPLRLYVFAHSGGSVGEYLRWADRLEQAEVWGLQLPGRGSRMAEPSLGTMAELVEAVVEQVRFEQPYAFFGHSLGALAAYETALALAARGLAGPDRLVLSAYRAPHLHQRSDDPRSLSAAELLDSVAREHGGLPPGINDDPELRDLMLDGLRADLGIVASYRYDSPPGGPDVPALDCPISVLGGADDHESAADLAAWSRHTTGPFDLRIFPGDHFYFREQTDDVIDHLAATLAQPAARALPRAAALGPAAPLS